MNLNRILPSDLDFFAKQIRVSTYRYKREL